MNTAPSKTSFKSTVRCWKCNKLKKDIYILLSALLTTKTNKYKTVLH